jgi:oligoribonuclease NrnB/cAMP/cGMP phosphodiesterase (DHH superfamily)
MLKNLIVCHDDPDGHLSGAIIYHWLPYWRYIGHPNAGPLPDGTERPAPTLVHCMNYGEEFPWDLVDEETEVFMADFSLQPWSEMIKLIEKCSYLTWIDHHKSSVERYLEWEERDQYSYKTFVQLDSSMSACEGCWSYCWDDKKFPRAVRLVGAWDTWKWQKVEGAREFFTGLALEQTDPSTRDGLNFWADFLSYSTIAREKVEEVIKGGKILQQYHSKTSAAKAKKGAFVTELHGLRALAMNTASSGSAQFESVWDPEKHDLMMPFRWKGGQWTVGLYTEKEEIDLSAIAKEHGGGGHRGAAGFEVDELPFQLK